MIGQTIIKYKFHILLNKCTDCEKMAEQLYTFLPVKMDAIAPVKLNIDSNQF